MWNSLEDIIKEKKLLENNREMLLKTMGEMLCNRGNKGAINEMADDILDLGKRINKLEDIVNCYKEDNDEPSYEYYGKKYQDTNFYSSRDKMEKLNEWKNKIDKGKVKPSVYTRLEKDAMERRNSQLLMNNYKAENGAITTDSDSVSSCVNRTINEINDTIDNRGMTNRFLVDLSFIDVPKVMVKSVEYFSDGLTICIYKFVDENMVPILKKLKEAINESRKFPIDIDHLSASNNLMYRECFSNCFIYGISQTPIDTNSNDFSYIYLNIRYDDVTYEAGKKQEQGNQGNNK